MTTVAPIPAGSRPQIDAQPQAALADEAVHVRLAGFEPATLATLRARMQDGAGRWWESQASFSVGPDGGVDLRTQAPVAGSYIGADPMGFVWAMTPTGDEPIEGPFAKATLDPTVI